MRVDAPALIGVSNRNRFLGHVKHIGYVIAVSCLLYSLGSSDLTLDLLASPSGGFECPGLEFAIGSCLFDHLHQPVGAIELREVAVGKGLRQITAKVS